MMMFLKTFLHVIKQRKLLPLTSMMVCLLMPAQFVQAAEKNGSGIEVKQQSFAWPQQQQQLQQFLLSQPQLADFSLLLIPTEDFNGDSSTLVRQLKRAGVSEQQLQLRYDLTPDLKKRLSKKQRKALKASDKAVALEVRLEWFVARVQACNPRDFGCADRNNLLRMAKPRELVIAPATNHKVDGISAADALQSVRDNAPLETSNAIGDLIGGR